MSGAEGDVWIGTTGSGVARLPPGWRGFHPIMPRLGDAEIKRVTSIAAGPDGSLWVGSANHGVQRWIPTAGTCCRPASHRTQHNEVIGLHVTETLYGRWSKAPDPRRSGNRRSVDAADRAPTDSDDHFEFLVPADAGDLWLGGENAYLLRLDASGASIAGMPAPDRA